MTLTVWLNLAMVLFFTVLGLIFGMMPAWFPRAVGLACIIWGLPMITGPQFILDFSGTTVTFTQFGLPTLFFEGWTSVWVFFLYLMTLNVFEADNRDYIGRKRRVKK